MSQGLLFLEDEVMKLSHRKGSAAGLSGGCGRHSHLMFVVVFVDRFGRHGQDVVVAVLSASSGGQPLHQRPGGLS